MPQVAYLQNAGVGITFLQVLCGTEEISCHQVVIKCYLGLYQHVIHTAQFI